MSRARQALGLEAAITKFDKYQLLILDDIAYVTNDQAETGVLFELIATRNADPFSSRPTSPSANGARFSPTTP
jgi:DNA replication protein DnaC